MKKVLKIILKIIGITLLSIIGVLLIGLIIVAINSPWQVRPIKRQRRERNSRFSC